MNLDTIEAIGLLLSTLNSDLNYFRDFREAKEKKEYNESFQYFLNEYRISRCFEKDKAEELFEITLRWLENNDEEDVDAFAEFLKQKPIFHNKKPLSLASKILFLNNPEEILPLDSLTVSALEIKKDRNYKHFYFEANKFWGTDRAEYLNYLEKIREHLELIEEKFCHHFETVFLSKVRQRRFLDKLLWVKGKNKK